MSDVMTSLPNGYEEVRLELHRRLREKAPSRAQILCGPRQVGKTTLLLSLADHLGSKAFYCAADSPEAALPGWWERVWREAEDRAQAGGGSVLFLDEVHYLPDWSRLLKARCDRLHRLRIPLHVVVSGSSALQLSVGNKETMAGRFEMLRLGHWSAGEIARTFGTAGDPAENAVRFGSFPGAVQYLDNYARWRSYVREAIIEPAVGRDILMLESVRSPALLRQLFAVCLGHPAEIVSLQKICGTLLSSGSIDTVSHYLDLLRQAFLVAGIDGYSERELRRRSMPPKIVVLNQAFLAATDQTPPTAKDNPKLYGRWVENACLAHAWNCGQTVRYWRKEPLEIDGVIDGSWGKWAVEVKTGALCANDLKGVLQFCRDHPAYRPLVLCDAADVRRIRESAIHAMSWRKYLLTRTPLSPE